ncbi:MAG: hypothetical protein GY749_16895 [Desulfobacteraceae bacterium]|nr:hypothetical protein [Desulfobacteraceae bacterium]
MKKLSVYFIVFVLCFTLSATSALAGSKQRHRWEGVAIGVGAAILGHAIIKNQERQRPEPVVAKEPRYYPAPPPPSYHRKHYRNHRGHWEYKKVWVAPVYEKVWNPGHYNRHKKWVKGKWIRIEVEPGHWVKEKVWVGHR